MVTQILCTKLVYSYVTAPDYIHIAKAVNFSYVIIQVIYITAWYIEDI